VIPTAGPSDGLAAGEVGTIFHLGQTADLRTNIGCNNLSGVAVPVSLELADTSGTVLDTLAVLVQPFSDHQRGNVFQDFVPVEGSVRVSHSHPDGVITCVGMVVYDVSADFRSESMHELTGSGVTVVVPRAVHQAGATTDLALLAPAGPAEARIDFLPTGQDNTTFVSTNVALADRQEIRLPAILDSVFSATGTGALRVVATSGSVLTSAVERRGPAGAETHRRARVEPLDNQVPAFHPVALIHLTEGPVHRTDLGVVNTSGLTVDVAVDLHDASGARLGTRSFELLPYSHAELQGVFASVGHPVVADGLARVSTTTSGGAFFAYAIVTELVTQDSWEMSAQALPTALFADGFETGDTARWSSSFPP
jgi:hypothetical protein